MIHLYFFLVGTVLASFLGLVIDRFNQVSDGVIVGSKIVKALHEKDASIATFIQEAAAYKK